MGYVLVGIIFLLIAAGFITFLVMSATKKNAPARAEEAGPAAGDTAPPFGTDDSSPLGDTTEHAGEQSGGETRDNDAEQSGGSGRPIGGGEGVTGGTPAAPPDGRRFQRDPIGGEAEARPFTGEDEDVAARTGEGGER